MTENEQIQEMAVVIQKGLVMSASPKTIADHIVIKKGYRKVERGEWKLEFTLDDTNFYRCSVCDRQETLLAKESTLEFFPYCHCGADMRKEGAE